MSLSNSPHGRGSVSDMVGAYLEAYQVLATARDFSPRNPDINRTLSHLVAMASKSYTGAQAHEILHHPEVRPRMRRMWAHLSRAEGEMEAYFGERLDKQTVRDFRYYANYEQLATAEIAQWKRSSHFRIEKHDQGIALPGAGPLPLTAVVMHQQTGHRITCIDSDPNAVRIGSRFLKKCGLDEDIVYRHADAAAYDYAQNPVVLVASLVGNKHGVAKQVMKSRTTKEFAVRSAEGVHILLYPPVSSRLSQKMGLKFDRRTAPTAEIINTTLFATLGSPQETPAPKTGQTRSTGLQGLPTARSMKPDSIGL